MGDFSFFVQECRLGGLKSRSIDMQFSSCSIQTIHQVCIYVEIRHSKLYEFFFRSLFKIIQVYFLELREVFSFHWCGGLVDNEYFVSHELRDIDQRLLTSQYDSSPITGFHSSCIFFKKVIQQLVFYLLLKHLCTLGFPS